MKHPHQHPPHDGASADHGHPHPHHRHHHGRRGEHGGHGPGAGRRLFDYGEIRLLILGMINERPRHGYELIREISDRFEGQYAPSPGVIYPTLSWLEDMGYITIEAVEGGRKLSRLTDEGQAFLTANAAAVAELMVRKLSGGPPARVRTAVEGLKAAIRGRLRREDVAPEEEARIVAILNEATRRITEESDTAPKEDRHD